ncbi:MAG: TetR/AcrR family transcriptional regulator [Nitrospirae bacterium]|nr:TetR/AcrR family transcriptional regulator [Nitrospirota bacterium]
MTSPLMLSAQKPGLAKALPLRERKRQRLQQDIFRAGIDLFMRRGYQPTSVEDICQRAEVSKRTFFNYFQSKDEILRKYAERGLELAKLMLAEPLRNSEMAMDRIQDLLRALIEEAESNHDFYREVFHDLLRAHLGFSADGRKVEGLTFMDLIIPLMREGQRRGEFSKRQRPEVLAESISGMFTSVILNWLRSARPTPLLPRFREAIALFLRGARP